MIMNNDKDVMNNDNGSDSDSDSKNLMVIMNDKCFVIRGRDNV